MSWTAELALWLIASAIWFTSLALHRIANALERDRKDKASGD